MARLSKFRMLFLAILVIGVIAALLVRIPIGSVNYLRSQTSLGNNINISEPRYVIPREIVFPSNIGSQLGLLPVRDPHFYGTDPIQFSVKIDSVVSTAIAQGFDINYRFERSELKKNLLAISTGGAISTVAIDGVCFRCWTSTGQLFALGQTSSSFFFLVNKPSWESDLPGLVRISLPLGSENVARLHVAGTEAAKQMISDIKSFDQNDSMLTDICASRSKPLITFVEQNFEINCDNA